MIAPIPAVHPVTTYAVDVADRRIVAGLPVQWICQKHLDDLEHGEKRAGLWFDEAAADRIVRFFAQLVFVEGDKGRTPFILEPWQVFCLGSIFGWMRDTGFRRFRQAWLEVASGNGKSPVGSGVGLYGTGWDGHYGTGGKWQPEYRAQCFTAANKLKQARNIHGGAVLMREHSPYLKARLDVRRDRLIHPETDSYFEPLGRDSKTEDGWNPNIALFDEVHSYANRGMWDILAAKMVKRPQSLILALTTAGYGGTGSFGVQQHEYYRKVIDPRSGLENDQAFVYIAELEPRVRCAACKSAARPDEQACPRCDGRGFSGDDYTDEGVWLKANPNLGVSVYVDGLRDRVAEAQGNKRVEPDVLVKNFNVWQQSGERAISMEVWDACDLACPMPSETELRRRPCFGGLDLGSNRDLTCLVLYWPACGPWKKAAVKPYFWVAEDTVPIRLKEDTVDYTPWIDAGEIFTTKGEFVDQDAIRKKANELAGVYTIKKLGADRKFGEKLLPELAKDGFEVYRIAQSPANICPAWQKLEQLLGNREIALGEHTVLRWNAGNVVLKRDEDLLEWPSKAMSKEKIDGIAALLDAIHLAMSTPYEGSAQPPESHALPQRRGGGKRAILEAFR